LFLYISLPFVIVSMNRNGRPTVLQRINLHDKSHKRRKSYPVHRNDNACHVRAAIEVTRWARFSTKIIVTLSLRYGHC